MYRTGTSLWVQLHVLDQWNTVRFPYEVSQHKRLVSRWQFLALLILILKQVLAEKNAVRIERVVYYYVRSIRQKEYRTRERPEEKL